MSLYGLCILDSSFLYLTITVRGYLISIVLFFIFTTDAKKLYIDVLIFQTAKSPASSHAGGSQKTQTATIIQPAQAQSGQQQFIVTSKMFVAEVLNLFIMCLIILLLVRLNFCHGFYRNPKNSDTRNICYIVNLKFEQGGFTIIE